MNTLYWFAYLGLAGLLPGYISYPSSAASASQAEERAERGEKEIQLKGNHACSLSPSGKYIATLGLGGTIVIWDAANQKRLAECKASMYLPKNHAGIAYKKRAADGIAFDSTNDEVLYLCNDEAFQRWQWRKGLSPTPIYEFSEKDAPRFWPTVPAIGMANSPDGKFLAVIEITGTVGLLRIDEKKKNELATFPSIKFAWVWQAFLPDSSKLIWKDFDSIKSVTLGALNRQSAIIAKSQEIADIRSLALSPSGKIIATSNKGGELCLWDFGFAKRDLFFTGLGETDVIAFSPDGKLLVTGGRVISVFEVKTKKRLAIADGQAAGFSRIGFLPDNVTIYATGDYSNVRFWRLDQENKLHEVTK